jgi:kynurenine--oxoglutarate transaminase/cysteine-S-conjugate beta-lyase/glutamine--phenylpyruvate transaminase
VNWESEVTVGVGATETLFATMQALINEGDEAVLISPAFDIYSAQVQMAGGVCRYVPLRLIDDPARPGEKSAFIQSTPPKQSAPPTLTLTRPPILPSPAVWNLDMEELKAAFNDRTRVILINSPHNPTGKCFTRAELTSIAAIVQAFPKVVAISDEVYEHLVYDGKEHVRLATIPGMWERTITVSSSGKTFSVTGWKIGWAVGPEALIKGLVLTNQWVQFSVSTPAQHAIAICLVEADKPYEGYPSYYAWLNAQYTTKRDALLRALTDAGLRPVPPQGGFFIIADTGNVDFPEHHMQVTTKAAPVMRRDWAFCRFLTLDVKVAAIPPSAFYEGDDKDIARNMARFAFCKGDDSLEEAGKRLRTLRDFVKDKSLLPQ